MVTGCEEKRKIWPAGSSIFYFLYSLSVFIQQLFAMATAITMRHLVSRSLHLAKKLKHPSEN